MRKVLAKPKNSIKATIVGVSVTIFCPSQQNLRLVSFGLKKEGLCLFKDTYHSLLAFFSQSTQFSCITQMATKTFAQKNSIKATV
jgi:hypothetical protein